MLRRLAAPLTIAPIAPGYECLVSQAVTRFFGAMNFLDGYASAGWFDSAPGRLRVDGGHEGAAA